MQLVGSCPTRRHFVRHRLHALLFAPVLVWVSLLWQPPTIPVTGVSSTSDRSASVERCHLDPRKTANGVRDLPLPDDLAFALAALRRRVREERMSLGLGWTDDALVVVDAASDPVRPDWYSDAWDRLVRQAQLPQIRLHDACHTSVTNMLCSATMITWWRGGMVHDEAVMCRAYAHVSADDLRALATLAGQVCGTCVRARALMISEGSNLRL